MNRPDYTVVQKVVHWLMALLIMLDLVVAQKFGDPMEQWDRLESRSDHATLGMIMTFLFLLRIALRWYYGAPPLPHGMSTWQVFAARWTHRLFYFLIALLIGSGLATGVNAADPITLFGSLDITIGQENEQTFAALRPIHEYTTNALILLISIHIIAALYHQFVARDASTLNMLKFWTSKS